MALPKKRKKLENVTGISAVAELTGTTAPKNKPEKRTKGSPALPGSKKSKQMSKAFEIMDRIESPNDLSQPAPRSDGTTLPVSPAEEKRRTPEKILFRISLERKTDNAPNTVPEQPEGSDNKHELDFGITIPAFIWKIPVLKKAAEKVLLRLSTHG